MSISSWQFVAAMLLIVVVFHLVPLRRQRQLLLCAINLAFIGLLVPNLENRLCLAIFIVATYGMLRIVRAWPSYHLVLAFVVAVVAVFIYLRDRFLDPFLPQAFELQGVQTIGLSYMVFKFIDVLVHQGQGALAPCNFVSYANYQLAFFTLLAGPIQRYNDFQPCWADVDAQPGDWRDNLRCWGRMLTGMLKMAAIAPAIDYLFLWKNPAATSAADVLPRFAGQFYGYPIYLFFNFSGYTDIVIGCAGLLGFRLPENFHQPFRARNLLDFWRRWHMTLTAWVRDFIFIPLYKNLAGSSPARLKQLISYALLFLALFIVGIWHGITAGFAAFGAIHGLGVALNQAYADLLRAWLGRAGVERYQKNWLIHAAAHGLTFHFVCFSFLFFAPGFQPALAALDAAGSRLGVVVQENDVEFLSEPWLSESLAAAFCLLLLIVVGSLRDVVVFPERWRRWLTESAWAPFAIVFGKSLLIVAVFLLQWATEQKDPDVVYRRF